MLSTDSPSLFLSLSLPSLHPPPPPQKKPHNSSQYCTPSRIFTCSKFIFTDMALSARPGHCPALWRSWCQSFALSHPSQTLSMLIFQFHIDWASSVFHTIKPPKRLLFFDLTGFLHRKTLGIIYHPKPPLQPYDALFTRKNNHLVYEVKLLYRLLSDYRSYRKLIWDH